MKQLVEWLKQTNAELERLSENGPVVVERHVASVGRPAASSAPRRGEDGERIAAALRRRTIVRER